MRGLRLHERSRRPTDACGTDEHDSKMFQLRSRSHESGRRAARPVARDGRRALLEV